MLSPLSCCAYISICIGKYDGTIWLAYNGYARISFLRVYNIGVVFLAIPPNIYEYDNVTIIVAKDLGKTMNNAINRGRHL